MNARRDQIPVNVDMAQNSYMSKINNIDAQIKFAESLERVKSRVMIENNPNYPSSMGLLNIK